MRELRPVGLPGALLIMDVLVNLFICSKSLEFWKLGGDESSLKLNFRSAWPGRFVLVLKELFLEVIAGAGREVSCSMVSWLIIGLSESCGRSTS